MIFILVLIAVLAVPIKSHAFLGLGCIFCSDIEKAEHVLDKGIKALNQNSREWQDIVNQLRKEIPAQVNNTISVELDGLVQRGLAYSTASVKCIADYTRTELQLGLRNIKRSLLGKEPEIGPVKVCQVSVTGGIDLSKVPQSLKAVSFFGHNFDQNGISFSIVSPSGSRPVEPLFVSRPTDYQITVALTNNGVRFKTDDVKLALNHPTGTYDLAVLQNGADFVPSFIESEKIGGSGGNMFTDSPTSTESITSINLRFSRYIDQIQTVRNGRAQQAHGGGGGSSISFTLQPQEYIKGIRYRAHAHVDALKFITNKRESDWFGGQGGVEGQVILPEGYELIGFKGQGSAFIDQLRLLGREREPDE